MRERVAYMGAKFGSATMTSWPRASRQRATHSLSVEASMRIRARGREPRTAAKRSASVRVGRKLKRAFRKLKGRLRRLFKGKRGRRKAKDKTQQDSTRAT